MGTSKANLVLVHAVDQLLDYYEVEGKPLPESISVDGPTYDALCDFVRDKKLSHYRRVKLKIVKRNNKT